MVETGIGNTFFGILKTRIELILMLNHHQSTDLREIRLQVYPASLCHFSLLLSLSFSD
jgi:hypothetical protein